MHGEVAMISSGVRFPQRLPRPTVLVSEEEQDRAIGFPFHTMPRIDSQQHAPVTRKNTGHSTQTFRKSKEVSPREMSTSVIEAGRKASG